MAAWSPSYTVRGRTPVGQGSPEPVGSGNILADKRYRLAEALLREGDAEAAADLFAQATEQAPDWAPAYLAQALALEQAGRRNDALQAFRAAAARDHDGRLGASLHVGRLASTACDTMPAAYVRALFDDYAPRFDRHLVEALGYRGPSVIIGALDAVAPDRRYGATLDLGCGTGLMARALTGRAGPIDGIDLSPGMLAEAEATGLYRALQAGDCTAVTRALPAAAYELAVAADMLVYLGDLAPLFTAVARVLVPGGLFAATVQVAATVQAGPDGFELGPDLRFRHGPDYLGRTLAQAGFGPTKLSPCVTRQDRGADVPGLVFAARRT